MVDTCVLVAVETFKVFLADVDHLEQENMCAYDLPICLRLADLNGLR